MSVVSVTSPRRFENTLWLVLFTLYVGGLLVWLGLGLIPPLTEAFPPLQDLIVWLADTRTPLAGTARRMLENAPDLPHPGLFVFQYLFSVINLSLGLLLALRLPHDVVPRLLAVALIGTAATFNQPSHVVYSMIGQPLPVQVAHTSFHVVSGVAYLLAVVLFPDGRLPRSVRIGRTPALALARDLTVALVALALYRTRLQDHTKLLVVFFGVVVPIAGVVAQTLRIRSDKTPNLQRRQSRLLRAALVPALVVAVAWLVVQGMGWLANDRIAAGADDVVPFVFPMVFAVVPVVLLATILKYRLWDVDVLLSRAVLVLLVGVLVALTYAVAVGAAGTVFRGRGWSAALAVVVIAVVVEPVARRCEHLANRLVFGQELTPRQAMHALSDRLSRPDASSELTELTRILVAGTRCSSAAVWLVLPDTLVLATAHPEGRADRLIRVPRQPPEMQDVVDAFPGATCIPVTYEHDLIAAIVLTLPAGVTLPAPEARLIQDLARQAGLLVANARLTAALAREVERVQASAAELRRSREHVVVAQDGERRRLERDIHDGAQQELVALLIELGTAQRTLTAQGALRADQVQHLEGGVAAARATVDELRLGGHPRVLRAEGLPGALRSIVASARRTGLAVDHRCNVTSRLPADVEGATYFCCLEALQNVEKHAHASRAEVSVGLIGGNIVFSVSDDGVGIVSRDELDHSGLSHLAERVSALGGCLQVESAPGRGTSVRGEIPVVGPAATEARGG